VPLVPDPDDVEEIQLLNSTLEASRYLLDGPWVNHVRILELNSISDRTKTVNLKEVPRGSLTRR
jgi:hypothetical protein